ncbi:hypothetical protein [Sinorhizobium medicae]|uniref:hypothetical protein n=1 Tax=Sinorhizobium medicae TaxID=110321 RepID=UPI000FDAD3A6|nr:hypothetical protein [Sinorhizobium medicae]RVJ72214.1 hypothetical protein CN168_27130 [Sinorhizobium medicae]
MSRWIRVQTSIFDHEVFAAEPFSEREAWLWLISKAAWKDTVHRIGASVMPVPAGSLFVTIREMQAAWKWTSTRRVHQFLELLSSQNMIETCSETGKTLVTICNYGKYQNAETHSETPESAEAKQKRNTKDTSTPGTNTSSLRSEETAPAPSKQKSKQDVEGFKAAIATVLDADRVEAICTVRRKKGAVFTAHAGKLLVDALTACPDPASAADEMVLRNWTSVKPEWLDRNGRQQSRGPPTPQKTAFQLHQEAFAKELDKTINGNDRYDDRPDNVVDLAATDYRYSGTPSPVRR